MRDRNTVGGAQTAEIPALHAAGKALTDRGAGDVDELAGHEMIGLDFSANRDQRVFRHAKFRDLALRLDLGDGELAALRLRQINALARARTELQRDIAVPLLGAMRDNLTAVQLQNRDGNVFPAIGEDSGHAELLSNYP